MIRALAHVRKQDESKSKARLEAALWEGRVNQYKEIVRVFVHLTALGLIGLQTHALLRPSFAASLRLAMGMFAWILHHSVISETLVLNKRRLRLVNLILHFATGIFMYNLPGDCNLGVITSGLAAATRFTMAVLFVDIEITLPAQVMMSFSEIWKAWQRDPGTVILFLPYELLVGSCILAVSGLVESSMRRRMATLLNSESMLTSFRQMLRGVCDGEVLLDSKLRVTGKGCLKRLLMTSEDFSHRSFEELLVEEERPTFRRFMLDSGDVAEEAQANSAPTCLRVSLKRAEHRIGVDLFHVKMPQLLGEETYHLVALREDCESRAPPFEAFNEAAENTNQSLEMDERSERPNLSSCNRSDASGSVPQVASNSLIQLCKELQEMTLLVDATTPLFDVEQAHLSFLRQSDEADSGMLSLRRLVRPTDWGTVQAQLREFALADESSPTHRNVLKMKLRFQDDAKRCVEARAEVSSFAHSGEQEVKKLCLQIGATSLAQPKRTPRCQLQGVHEASGESEDEIDGF
eukprot:symbB.v1.2.039623.t1/scaffold6689.1/size16162/1